MKKQHQVFTLLFTLLIASVYGQKRNCIKPDSKNWTNAYSTVNFIAKEIHLKRSGDKSALLWVNDINFKNGIIKLDIKGKNEKGNSFLGVAFHGKDDINFDAVYFRPFNFKDPVKKNKSVQYINHPDEPWHVLRRQFPEKYENAVFPVPDPNNWFHVKIEVQYPLVKVYVNDAEIPSLEVKQRSKRIEGKVGLLVDSKDGWFKNVVITKSK